MGPINSDQIDRFLEDISTIKTVINRNRSVLRQLFNPAPFRWFVLMVGLSTIGFSMLIFFLAKHFGSFGSIPGTLKTIIYITIAVCAVFMQLWKGRAYSASAKQINPDFTLGWAFKTFYSNKIAHIYISHVALILFLSIFFIIRHIPYFIIPTFSIGIALLAISFGVILQVKYSLHIGYWCLFSGICTIVFSSIPAPFAVVLTFGCCMLILAFLGFQSSRSQPEYQSNA